MAPAKKKSASKSRKSADELPPRAFLPRAVFAGLALATLLMAGLEVRNVLRHPSVKRCLPAPVTGEDGRPLPGEPLVFYQKGAAASRVAWLFCEPEGSAGPPRLIQRIDCSAADQRTGSIIWTGDGAAAAALSREPRAPGEDPVVLWLYEFGTQKMFVRDSSWAVTGQTVIQDHPLSLQKRWHQHGGTGESAASWYDLGARGAHLFFWQVTRWEQALPDP